MKQPITFTHRVSPNATGIKISLDRSGGICVTSPKFTPMFLINAFVKQQEPWIRAQQEKLALLPRQNTPTTVVIFDTPYQKKVRYESSLPFGIATQGKTLFYNLLSPPTTEPLVWNAKAEEALMRFLQQTARAYILPRTKLLGQKMKTTYERISLKEQKTRWGSCSSRGNLNFNWRLVHFKPEIIDYVIIHELAHRTHMDHSHLFWGLVGKYDPEYTKHRGWLKRQGGSIG